jgi:hypothetical protein
VNINLYTWFDQRQLDYCPKHFIKANAPAEDNNVQWVQEKLLGRYYIGTSNTFFDNVIYFEDPSEAVFYDLTWS